MDDLLNFYLNKNELYSEILIATGYWDLPGLRLILEKLKKFIETGGKVRMIIGKEPVIRGYQLKEDDRKFPDFYIHRDIAQLTEEYQECAEFLLKNITEEDNSSIQIRIYGQGEIKAFLHSKAYILKGKGTSVAVIGSSNFTARGLCDNSELNYLETNTLIVSGSTSENSSAKGHISWFEEKWDQSQPWNNRFIREVLGKTPLGEKAKKELTKQAVNLSPFETYIRLLQYEFGDIIDRKNMTQLQNYIPEGMMPLEYQFSAVNQCFATMRKHGGFLLADVVGLGKTIVGTLLIKRFLAEPGEKPRKVLIVAPPAIVSGWKDTILKIDDGRSDVISPYIDLVTTGSIGNYLDDDDYENPEEIETELPADEKLNLNKKENYGLVIIDESHKFRNNLTNMYRNLDELISLNYTETGEAPYIGLLSATPQNNRPDDLKNQLYLFQRTPKNSTLEKIDGGNLEAFFADIGRRYQEIIATKEDGDYGIPQNKNQELVQLSTEIREKVLSDLLVRRTRTDVKKHYLDDLEKQNIKFPQISGPHILSYIMDQALCSLFNDTIDTIGAKPDVEDGVSLGYYRYRAIEFLTDQENRQKYRANNRDVHSVAVQLAKIMQILLVKRLESSFKAFRHSLSNLAQYTTNMVTMLERDAVFICPSLNVNEEFKKAASPEQCFDILRKKIEVLNREGKNEKGQNAEYRTADFNEDYLAMLREDLQRIKKLCKRWADNDYDPKFDKFKESLNSELFNPKINTSGKLVIFTEAKDTLQALERAVTVKGHRPLVISAENRKDKEQAIRENFDANYTGTFKDDYDTIITTEVLAEGVNLHRANVILNYDTPWNSTRLMQRIGRVNRIGSVADTVYVFNFMPSANGDQLINLVRKAHTKLQSFHTLFGEDSKIFSEAEEISTYDDLKTFVDGEESPLQKYISELRTYREENPERYTEIQNITNPIKVTINSEIGNSLFLVRSLNGKRLYVKVNEEAAAISTQEMMDAFSAATAGNPSKMEIENQEEIIKKAILAFNQHFAKRTQIKETKIIKNAVKARQEIDKFSFTDETKLLLNQADKMVRKGNHSIAKLMIAIAAEITTADRLIPLTEEELQQIVESKLKHIVREVEHKQGKAEVAIALFTKNQNND